MSLLPLLTFAVLSWRSVSQTSSLPLKTWQFNSPFLPEKISDSHPAAKAPLPLSSWPLLCPSASAHISLAPHALALWLEAHTSPFTLLLIKTASLPACHYLFVIQSMWALNFLFKAFLLLLFARACEILEAGPNTSDSIVRWLYSFKEARAVIDLQNETLPHS